MPEVRGECRITAAHSYRDARSTVGTVPMLCPYRIIFSGLMPYLFEREESKANEMSYNVIYSQFTLRPV